MKIISKYQIAGFIGRLLIFIPLTLIIAVVSITSDYRAITSTKKGDLNGDGIR